MPPQVMLLLVELFDHQLVQLVVTVAFAFVDLLVVVSVVLSH